MDATEKLYAEAGAPDRIVRTTPKIATAAANIVLLPHDESPIEGVPRQKVSMSLRLPAPEGTRRPLPGLRGRRPGGRQGPPGQGHDATIDSVYSSAPQRRFWRKSTVPAASSY